jgi:hypothetical protein
MGDCIVILEKEHRLAIEDIYFEVFVVYFLSVIFTEQYNYSLNSIDDIFCFLGKRHSNSYNKLYFLFIKYNPHNIFYK